MIRWLEAHVRPGGKWSSERVIVFTEYRDTQKWLHTILASEGFAGPDRLMTLYGGMDSEERERIKAAFQADPSQSAVRILLATDAASEGIDLQNHCHRLIHNEIPWNPNRLEQRNGRIDRHGQRKKEVLIYHFVGKGYRERARSPGQRAGDLLDDLEFLMQAAQKVQAIREDLGKVGPVIAEQVEEAMLGDRTVLDTSRAEEEAKPVRNLLKFERDLKAQIDRLVDELQATRKELHLSPENIQTVVETALELARQPALLPAELKGVWPDPLKERTRSPVFRLPAVKGTWALCSEGLAHPHTGEIRPIVFDHNLSKGRDDVVLAHLNHRLVQMSLRLLRAEVWSREGTKRLHRVTARIVPDHALDTPAVIGHARLIIIGGDCHLLHEEIITAGGSIREGRFRRMNVGEVERALEAGLSTEPSEAVKERLAGLWPEHADSLALALDQRAKERTSGLEKALLERADKEVADITTVLTELQRSIEVEVRQPAVVQLELFNDIEKEQVQRNRESLEARLRELPAEIERETGAIRGRFEHPTPRLFPVAVTYLVPEKLARE